MTIVGLLYALKSEIADAVKNMELPTAVHRGDEEADPRVPEVHINRLPESREAMDVAPYIIVQFVNSRHIQKPADAARFFVTVRFIFATHNQNEEEGSIELLNVMERVHQRLLKKVKIGKAYLLDVNEPLEMLVYPDDTAPYYAGEMIGTFYLPATEREVKIDEIPIGKTNIEGSFGGNFLGGKNSFG